MSLIQELKRRNVIRVAIAYGIAFATILTLFILPILLSYTNAFKVFTQWLITGNRIEKEEVERAIKELKSEQNAGN